MKKMISAMMTLSMVLAVTGTVFADPSIGSSTALDGVMGQVLGVVQAIAVAFAIGMLLYVGIKYTMASANEKADLKKGSISYVIGAVIIFGASGLIGIVRDSLAPEITGG